MKTKWDNDSMNEEAGVNHCNMPVVSTYYDSLDRLRMPAIVYRKKKNRIKTYCGVKTYLY